MAFNHLLWTLQLAKAVDAIGGTGQNLVSVLISEGHKSWGEEESSPGGTITRRLNTGACHSHGPKSSVSAFTDQGKAQTPKERGEVIPTKRSAQVWSGDAFGVRLGVWFR